MLTDQDAIRLWRQLFRGQSVTTLTLKEAASVVEGLPLDSPVRQRLSTELGEIRRLHENGSTSESRRRAPADRE